MSTHEEVVRAKGRTEDPLDVSFKPRAAAELTLEAPQRSSIHEAAKGDSRELRESDSFDD